MLNNSVKVLEMFLNKASNAGVFWYCLRLAVFLNISGHWASNRYVVDIWLSHVRNFLLKDMSDVVMEDWYRIGPSHR